MSAVRVKKIMVGGAPPVSEDDAKAAEEDTAEPVYPPPTSPARRFCWDIATHPKFDALILFAIMLNCFFMAIEDPVTEKDADDGNILYFDMSYAAASAVGFTLLIVFTIESYIKIIAFTPWGYFWGPDASWNRLDFLTVFVGWMEEYPDFLPIPAMNLSFLRIFRVFRPLRTLGKVEGMKALIGTMMVCVDPLTDVLNLTIFVFFVFSVLGMELFQGQGSQRCIDASNWDEKTQKGTWSVLSDDFTYPIEERRCGGDFTCPEYEGVQYECYNVGRNPEAGILKQNQADGIIGYDNLGQAMLTVFVFCTLEGWVDGMYQYQDSFQWAVSALYHTFMVLLGTFFCMNLALAVIADTFEGENESADEELVKEEEEEAKAKADAKAKAEAEGREYEGSDDEVLEVDEETGEEIAPRPEDTVSGLLHDLSYNHIFGKFIIVLILLNTATLAMEHARTTCLDLIDVDPASAYFGGWAGKTPKCLNQADMMDQGMQDFLFGTNIFFVVAFAAESFIKCIGLRPKYYFKDPFNSFDFVIVIMSFVELFAGGGGGLTALRCFRLARLFKMARSWGSLRAIIESLIEVLPSMTSLTVLLTLYMFIASVAGMQMLGNFIPYEERSRFTDFGIAMLTVFQMLTGENWNEVMFSAITGSGGYIIVIYFLAVVIIGNFLVLNLFLAIMLSDFNCGEPPDFSLTNAINTFCPFLTKKGEEGEEKDSAGLSAGGEGAFFTEAQLERMAEKENVDLDVVKKRERERARSTSIERKTSMTKEGKHGSMEMVAIRNDLKAQRIQKELEVRQKLEGVSLGFLDTENKFRRGCMKICRDPLFESFILFCIIVSSIMLACNGPTNDDTQPLWIAFAYIDFVFIVIFTIECTLKIVTQGFYFCPDGYLKDPWNILDFCVVMVGWISADYPFLTVDSGSGLGALRTLRSLRALRPLRTIQRLPGMRLVVNVLFECVPVFINICFVVLFFFIVFAIMGVQFFAGRFWTCNDTSVHRVDQCWGCFEDGDGSNPHANCPDGYSKRVWRNPKMNFDNVMNALLTLYEVAGQEMWLDVMYSAMDTRPGYVRKAHGADDFPFGAQPVQERNSNAAWYFVFFILIGVFVVLNLFVGGVVDKFNELKNANGGKNPLQTEEQAQYTESMTLMARMRPFKVPLPPKRPTKAKLAAGSSPEVALYNLRSKCYAVVMWDTSGKGMGTTFDMIISLMVMLNIIVMGLYYWKRLPNGAAYVAAGEAMGEYQNTPYYQGLEVLNTIFTFIFLAEMSLKITAWGIKQYLQDMWNQLDFVLVISSVLGFIVEVSIKNASFPLNPAVFRILRVARLTRALKSIRMVGRVKGIANLVDTLVIAIPAMTNVASLCFLVIFIFAVIGMDFFGEDDIDKEYVNGMYNRHANFRYFGDAFMVLFRQVTGEAWNGVMHDIMVADCDPAFNPLEPDDKDYDEDYCGTPHSGAWSYFVIFHVFVTGLLFELITAIVLDEFGKMNESQELPVNPDMISNFNDHWALLDPKATKMIPQYKLMAFLCSVEPPIFDNREEAAKELFSMNIAATSGADGQLMVHYVDTLVAVVRYQFVKKLGPEVGDELDVTMIESPELTNRIIDAYPHLKKIEKMEPKDFKQEMAATKMQGLWNKKHAGKRMAEHRESLEKELAAARGEATVSAEIKAMNGKELNDALRQTTGGPSPNFEP